MAMPDYQRCMLPFLTLLADGADHALRDIEEHLASHFALTSAERAQRW